MTSIAFRPSIPFFAVAVLTGALSGSAAPRASGQVPANRAQPAPERRAAVGKVVSPTGSLLYLQGPQSQWRAARYGDAISSTDLLLTLPADQAVIHNQSETVRLMLWGNAPELSGLPMLESAVILHADPEVDLGFTLGRGRVTIRNRKAEGSVRVRVGIYGRPWEFTLEGRDSEVALELYSRWPTGTPFNPQPGPEDVPTTAVVVWVLKGEAALRIPDGDQYSLRAPPGPACFRWNNVSGHDAGPQRREKLPSWAAANARETPEARADAALLESWHSRLAEEAPADVLKKAVQVKEPAARALAVYGLAALDDLPALIDALADEKQAEVRQTAVRALRHWIGRGPRQVVTLHQYLIKERHYSPGQAQIVVELLHGLSEEADRDQPETYETLIAYLGNDKLPIRELAKEQLEQWAPVGKDIAFDAAAGAEERDRAIAAWKKLVPAGRVPGKSKGG